MPCVATPLANYSSLPPPFFFYKSHEADKTYCVPNEIPVEPLNCLNGYKRRCVLCKIKYSFAISHNPSSSTSIRPGFLFLRNFNTVMSSSHECAIRGDDSAVRRCKRDGTLSRSSFLLFPTTQSGGGRPLLRKR